MLFGCTGNSRNFLTINTYIPDECINPSIYSYIQPPSHSIHPLRPSCVNSKSSSKSLFFPRITVQLPCVQKVNQRGVSCCGRLVSPIHSLCKFILHANSISMQLPFCRFIIYIVCLYSSVTSLSAHCRQTPPFKLVWNFDRDRSCHLWDYWSSIYSEAFICSKEF